MAFDLFVGDTNQKIKSLPYKDGDILIDKICMSAGLHNLTTAVDFYYKGKSKPEKVYIEIPSLYMKHGSREQQLWMQINTLVL